jgi:flagellar hook-basal body complex protein FliE
MIHGLESDVEKSGREKAIMEGKIQLFREEIQSVMAAMQKLETTNEGLAAKLADREIVISQFRAAELNLNTMIETVNNELSAASDGLEAARSSQRQAIPT